MRLSLVQQIIQTDINLRMKTTIYLFIYLSFFLLVSCNTDQELQSSITQGNLALRMSTSKTNASESVDRRQISDLTGYLFEEGILAEVYSNLSVSEEGIVEGLNLAAKSDARLYLLANAANILDEGQFIKGSFPETDFRELTVTSDPLPEKGAYLFMSGQLDMNGISAGKVTEFWLTRGFARFDVELETGVVIEKITVDQVAQSGYLLPQESVQTPENAQRGVLQKVCSPALSTRTEGVLYFYEQTGDKLTVTITARINGVKNTLEATLPHSIRRNYTYNIKVTAIGASIKATIQELPWGADEGFDANIDLTQKIKVDVENSTLLPGIRVNHNNDTIFVPHYSREFRIALNTADSEVKIRVNGNGYGDKITLSPTRSAIDVITQLASPGSAERYLYVDIQNVEASDDFDSRIVIAIDKNRTEFTGEIHSCFNEQAVCELNEYMDRELGTVEIPEGGEFSCESEDNWLKVEQIAGEQQRYRILGGYRPNDSGADGRMQRGSITITHSNGAAETYPVSRPNKGLPVVLIGDTYWCKFNLQGNARSFEEQVQISDSIAEIDDLYAYLKTCTDEQYMELMGDAYKGTNHTGLKLMYTGTGDSEYAYRNYASTAAGGPMQEADPTKQCPPGYQIPSSEDFCKIYGLYGTTTVFYGPFDEEIQVPLSQNNGSLGSTYHQYRRENVNYDGHTIPVMISTQVSFSDNTPPFALFGMGSQDSNTAGVAFDNHTFATFGDKILLISRLYLRMIQGDIAKTNTIRCIKTPPSFIY